MAHGATCQGCSEDGEPRGTVESSPGRQVVDDLERAPSTRSRTQLKAEIKCATDASSPIVAVTNLKLRYYLAGTECSLGQL